MCDSTLSQAKIFNKMFNKMFKIYKQTAADCKLKDRKTNDLQKKAE